MEGLKLTWRQRHCLMEQLHQTCDAHVYRRTLAILEVARGRSISQVAKALAVTRQSVYNWVAEYVQRRDPDVLRDEPRSGRPSHWSDDHQALLRMSDGAFPGSLGYFAVNWTVLYCKSNGNTARASTFAMRQSAADYWAWAMSGSGDDTSWNPTRSWRKKRRFRAQIRHLPPRSVLLAEDETDLLLFPPLQSGWALRGRPRDVWISGPNARRVVFGAMNLCTGSRWFMPVGMEGPRIPGVPPSTAWAVPRLASGTVAGRKLQSHRQRYPGVGGGPVDPTDLAAEPFSETQSIGKPLGRARRPSVPAGSMPRSTIKSSDSLPTWRVCPLVRPSIHPVSCPSTTGSDSYCQNTYADLLRCDDATRS